MAVQITADGINLPNPLPVTEGGLGVDTITGILKGNGTSAVTAAVAGTDYQVPLVSGTNIKTINNTSLMGSGDLTIASGSIESVATVIGATDVTLTASSAGYQSIAMTAMGKSVNLPDATTMTVGGPRFILKNDGGYPFGIRDAAGVLVMAVAAGGIAYVTLKDASTAAGSWSVIGDNLEPGLITIDNTFSSTYSSTVLKPFVAMDSNKSIHFLSSGSGFYAVCVDNATGVVGTPVAVEAAVSATPVAAFKISATSCIVFYSRMTNSNAVIITLSGATSLSVGAYAYVPGGDPGTTWGGEDFSGAPKIAQLTSTLYLASYTSGTNTSVVAISVSGTTVTIGSPVNLYTTSAIANSTSTHAITSSTALVSYGLESSPGSGNAQSYHVVVSVSGVTCTFGSHINAPPGGYVFQNYPVSICKLSATKFLVAVNSYVTALTVSGTSLSKGTDLFLESMDGPLAYTANNATRYNPHLFPLDSSRALLWYFDGSGTSAVVLTESGGSVTKGAILYRSIGSGAPGSDAIGSGIILPQGTNEFLAVRNQVDYTLGFWQTLTTCKITGTSITQGAGLPIRDTAPTPLISFSASRLTSGDYIINPRGYTIGAAVAASDVLPVLRSNGDFITHRGNIKCPSIGASNVMQNLAVSANRLVILGQTYFGTTAGASTYQLRLLSVEIAK